MTVGAALDRLVATIRGSRGVAHKRDIAGTVGALGLGAAAAGIRVGDDCAAIPDGDGYLLFAIEGFLDDFVAADPDFAGYCGVMVNVSDIAAMGGRPLAVVDAVWSRGEGEAAAILGGLRRGAAVYGVPVVGGHTNTRNAREQLAVAVLGRAKRLLTSFDARPGDDLVVAIDLRGRYREPHPYFDASTGAPPARLRADLEILAGIAEDGLAIAAKDVSMGGVAGTLLMLLECSGVGGVLDVERVPRPGGVPLDRWLLSFPSFGFVLAVDPRRTAAVLDRFHSRSITAAAVGHVDGSRVVRLADRGAEAVLWDFGQSVLIGCGPPHDEATALGARGGSAARRLEAARA